MGRWIKSIVLVFGTMLLISMNADMSMTEENIEKFAETENQINETVISLIAVEEEEVAPEDKLKAYSKAESFSNSGLTKAMDAGFWTSNGGETNILKYLDGGDFVNLDEVDEIAKDKSFLITDAMDIEEYREEFDTVYELGESPLVILATDITELEDTGLTTLSKIDEYLESTDNQRQKRALKVYVPDKKSPGYEQTLDCVAMQIYRESTGKNPKSRKEYRQNRYLEVAERFLAKCESVRKVDIKYTIDKVEDDNSIIIMPEVDIVASGADISEYGQIQTEYTNVRTLYLMYNSKDKKVKELIRKIEEGKDISDCGYRPKYKKIENLAGVLSGLSWDYRADFVINPAYENTIDDENVDVE